MKTISLILNDQDSLSLTELSEFCSFLNIAYDNLRENQKEVETFLSIDSEIDDEKMKKILALRPIKAVEFAENLSQDSASSVGIKSITKNSPFDITITIPPGLSIPILGAFIAYIFGFRIDKNKINKISASNLRNVIDLIKEKISVNEKMSIGYGVQRLAVTLNKEEYELLMKQDEKTKNNGGFQAFIISLQAKVNRKTHVLNLEFSDIIRITKAINNKAKGGFQSRLAKIFNRHFV